MKIITKEDIEENRVFYSREIKKGKLFVYPTDTIYGIGCDATNPDSIRRIRDLKKRNGKPFSIIVPDIHWIRENCYVKEEHKRWIDKLPGPYTFILKLKNSDGVARKELLGELDSIGVRIPRYWFAELLSEEEIPFVTTSVNITGEKSITCIDEISGNMMKKIDYIIDSGPLKGKPSTILRLVGGVEVIR